MNHPESILQRQCVTWFRLQYPQYLIYANGNGGYRRKLEAMIMQGEGITAGVPDLTLIFNSKVVWIEMKSEKGRLTESQLTVMDKLNRLLHDTYVCRSLDEFMNIVKKYVI